MRRSTAGAAAAAIGAATAVTALVIGATTGSAQTGTSSAYSVDANGIVDFEPQHAVSSDGTKAESDELIKIPDNELVTARVLGTNADGSTASARVAEVSIGGGQLEAQLIEVSCKGNSAQTTLVGLQIPGQDFDERIQPDPNTEVIPEQLTSVAKITLNRQTTNDDGSLTVDGVVVDLVDGTQEVIVSSATCAAGGGADNGGVDDGGADGGADNGGVDGGADDGGDDSGADGGADDGGPGATKPAPITTGLPVTG